jgi:hypothetical protein
MMEFNFVVNQKAKRKIRNCLSQGQNRLLQESLKQLLGDGLITNLPVRFDCKERTLFLRNAFDSKAFSSRQ